ncbi:hypothetical protein Tsubulata_010998 [Turnera subulata]|uniref:Peptidase A1 domain-containing protein n=1 Tax=Turnera subulata TaxID=218843 RepID=A0A9Q0JHB7_9ROSI|nr:hypothetical protein Tsubulata_010998 [Turnera subulata]
MTEILLALVIVAGLISSTQPLGLNNTPDSLIQSEKFELFHVSQIEHTYNKSLHARLVRDKRRVDSLTQILTNGQNMTSLNINVELDLMLNTLEYAVRLGVGSPPIDQYMLIDTGSNVPWIQCQPCAKCYHQVSPIYDPKYSNTYREVPCESTKCLLLDDHTCIEHQCRYTLSYGDKSLVKGVFALETFTLGNTKIPNIVFGCGHENRGTFINFTGILGLGRGDMSFIGQLVEKTTGIFSFCLADPGAATRGWLQIGGEAILSGAAWAPMIHNPEANPSVFYYIGFSGISVGHNKVPIPEQVFQLNRKGEGGVIVDTGTVVTTFPRVAYNAFRDAFLAQMEHFPRTHGVAQLDTCFKLTSIEGLSLPNVSFHFTGGVTLALTIRNILVQLDRSTVFCLAFAPAPGDLSIIGNIALQRIQVTIDSRSGRIGFGPKTCASPQPSWNRIRNESGRSKNNINVSLLGAVLISLYYLLFV